MVGGGVLKLLRDRRADIAARLGRPLRVVAVAVRNAARARKRLHPDDAERLSPSWQSALAHPEADIAVELIGGANPDGPAGQFIRAALAAGKPVVTANKALLAENGGVVFSAARRARRPVAFEAAVAGCVPVVKALRDRHGLKDSLSRGVEDSFAASLKPLMAEYGVLLDDVLVRVRNANHGPEVDILGLNGTTAVVGEVKLQLKREDVSVFSDDLRDFRDDFPEHARPKIYGVVAGMTIDEDAAALARKRGFFILQLDGAIVSPQTPKDFRPRPY